MKKRDLTESEIIKMYTNLDACSIFVMEARYGVNGKKQTLREIGSKLGISQESVRLIEKKSLKLIKCGLLNQESIKKNKYYNEYKTNILRVYSTKEERNQEIKAMKQKLKKMSI